MSDSKSRSKDNLGKSNMPLLSEEAEKAGDTPGKDVDEMELEEKKGDSTENFLFEFSSIFTEPTAIQGFDRVGKLNYDSFTQTKFWVLKFLSLVVSLPLAILWALVFSLVTVVYVWLVKPVIALFTVFMSIFEKIISSTVGSTPKPEKKKKKEKKEKKEPEPSSIEIHTEGLNQQNRGLTALNDKVNIELFSVFARPTANHGFDGVSKLNYDLFTKTRIWVYKVLSALVSLPLAILWALVFSLVTWVFVWLVNPLLALFAVFMVITKKILGTTVGSCLKPVARALKNFRKLAPTQQLTEVA